MVVTSSREHAVRYKQEFDKYIAEKGYTDIKTLVAFSGTVELDTGDEYTEVGMNNGHPREPVAEGVRQGLVPGADRRREVPDGLRPAAAAHDVCGQAPDGRAGRPDTFAAEPHACRQGRHVHSRFRQ